MNVRRDATADCLILSTSETMLFSAVSVPMLSSYAGRSLLIDAGTHTTGTSSPGTTLANCSMSYTD